MTMTQKVLYCTDRLCYNITMLKITEVTNKKLMKRFVEFAPKLYENCPHYVPYMYGDEMKMLNGKYNVTLKDCVAKYYLCERDGVTVGRVGAVLQKKYNAVTNKKNVRFTRFDCINDVEVARALLNTVERFAQELGMDSVMGPYGFNETDRSGYLTCGFDKSANFGTNYNYPYYEQLFSQCGYTQDVEWLELNVVPNDDALEKYTRVGAYALKKLGLRLSTEPTFSKFAKKYGWKMFQCFNAAYCTLPGFVPFEKDLYEQIRSQFSVALKPRYMSAVIDENEDVVGFAICFPSMAQAMKKIKGKLFPFGFITLLKSISKPKILDLCLIGVRKEYHGKGVNAALIANVLKTIKKEGIELTEAYPQLADNLKTLLQWKHFDTQVVKKRATVIKHIT